MYYKLLLSLALLFSLDIAYSQVTIHSGQYSDNKKSSSVANIFKIKTDFFEAVACGTGMIFVEKNISNSISIEVGVGVTYLSLLNAAYFSSSSNSGFSGAPSGNPFSGTVVSTDPGNIGFFSLYKSDQYEHNLGFAGSIFPKLYFDEDPTEGFFFGPQFMFKKYNYRTPNVLGGMKDQSLTKKNLTLNFGYTGYVTDNFHFETVYGLGVSFADDVRNMYYGSQDGTATFSPTRLHMTFGIRACYMIY